MQKNFWDNVPKKDMKSALKKPPKVQEVPDSVYAGGLSEEPEPEKEEYRPKWGPAAQAAPPAPTEDTRSAELPEGVDLLDSLIGGPVAPSAAIELEKLLNEGTYTQFKLLHWSASTIIHYLHCSHEMCAQRSTSKRS